MRAFEPTVVTESDEAVAHLGRGVSGLVGIREAERLPPIQLMDQRTSRVMASAPGAMTNSCGPDAQTRACQRWIRPSRIGWQGDGFRYSLPLALPTSRH